MNNALNLPSEDKTDTYPIKELRKACNGDEALLIFFVNWLKNGLNATKAYMELHPHVTYGSAEVLGSRWLRKVRKNTILEAYGLDISLYMRKLKEGLEATEIINAAVLVDRKGNIVTGRKNGGFLVPDYRTRFKYFETLGKLLQLV